MKMMIVHKFESWRKPLTDGLRDSLRRIKVKAYRHFVLPRNVARVRNAWTQGEVIPIYFFAANVSMWRYDAVYRKFLADKRFNPIIVTAMLTTEPMDVRQSEQCQMLDYFTKKGYRVVPGYDEATGRWIDLSGVKYGIMFYTQPYNHSVDKNLAFRHLKNLIPCYAPYSMNLGDLKWCYDNDLQNCCWRHYVTSESDKRFCCQVTKIKGANVKVVGYGFDEVCREVLPGLANAEWHNDQRKRIIWAPHHTIENNGRLKVSTFLKIAELMLRF